MLPWTLVLVFNKMGTLTTSVSVGQLPFTSCLFQRWEHSLGKEFLPLLLDFFFLFIGEIDALTSLVSMMILILSIEQINMLYLY